MVNPSLNSLGISLPSQLLISLRKFHGWFRYYSVSSFVSSIDFFLQNDFPAHFLDEWYQITVAILFFSATGIFYNLEKFSFFKVVNSWHDLSHRCCTDEMCILSQAFQITAQFELDKVDWIILQMRDRWKRKKNPFLFMLLGNLIGKNCKNVITKSLNSFHTDEL